MYRERERDTHTHTHARAYTYTYIYIYIYITPKAAIQSLREVEHRAQTPLQYWKSGGT